MAIKKLTHDELENLAQNITMPQGVQRVVFQVNGDAGALGRGRGK